MGSDYERIRLSFGKFSSTVIRATQDKKMHHSKRQSEEVAKNLERVVGERLIKVVIRGTS